MRVARFAPTWCSGLVLVALLAAAPRLAAAANACVPANCDDGNPCTTDVCGNGHKCEHTALNAAEACTVGTKGGTCHVGQCCTGCWNGTSCQPGTGKLACGNTGAVCTECGVGTPCVGNCATGTCVADTLPDGTSCLSGTGACWSGGCCAGTAAAPMCWNGTTCVAGGTDAACGTNGAMCATCANDDCGTSQTCSGGVCSGAAASTSPPVGCTLDDCHSVMCDGAAGSHCASFTRPVCSTDCRGMLTHNAYPGGFHDTDFRAATGVTVTAGALTSTASGVGHVISRNLSREISQWADNEQMWMLTKVHVKLTGQRGEGCDARDRIDVYLAIDEVGTGGAALPVPIQITDMPSATAPPAPFVIPIVQDASDATRYVAEQVYDLLTWGHKGTRLRWAADFINASGCANLKLLEVNIGYQAMQNDDSTADTTYKLRSFSSLIPLANLMYYGAIETPAPAWGSVIGGDNEPRGHLIAQSYYEPEDPNTQVITKRWDAGEELKLQAPGARRIFTMDGGGNTIAFTPVNTNGTHLAYLKQQVLPTGEWTATDPRGNKVFDFDDNGTVNEDDALAVMNWTLGCALTGSAGTAQSAADCTGTTPAKRPWPLGAIDRGMPAVVGPPNMPWWLNGTRIPEAMKNAYWGWALAGARLNRDTIAYIGAQDGMLHGFYAGTYKVGDDLTTADVEHRGYFAKTGSANTRDYGGYTKCQTRHAGDGTGGACPERFAYIPRALLDTLRNNVTTPGSGKNWTLEPSSHPRAAIDASPLVEDIVNIGVDGSGNETYSFRTVLFSGIGPLSPYIFALDITDPNNPIGLWEQRYENFRGTLKNPPSAGMARMPGGNTHVVVFNSGFGWQALDPYFFVINAVDGTLIAQAPASSSGQKSYGTLGSPLLLDMDGDGFSERAYMLDTGLAANGTPYFRVVRLSLRPTLGSSTATNPQVCEVYNSYTAPGGPFAEGAFAGLTGYVCDPSDPTGPCTSASKVRLYFATSDDPRWDDTIPSGPSYHGYHGYAIEDLDPEPDPTSTTTNPVCAAANHNVQFQYELETSGSFPEKSWLTPAIDMEYVYYATLRSPTDSECDWGSGMAGRILKLDLDAGETPSIIWQQALTVQPIGSVRVYDQHVFLGTTGGTPSISGETTKLNNPTATTAQIKVGDAYWKEE